MSSKTFEHKTKIGLHHTDAAGILFYSQIFVLAYEAFDAWMQELGISIAWIIKEADFLFPYVHAKADYLEGMQVGDLATIHLRIKRIGDSSLLLNYDFFVNEKITARVQTVHVAIDKVTKQKIPLPPSIRQAFEKHFNS